MALHLSVLRPYLFYLVIELCKVGTERYCSKTDIMHEVGKDYVGVKKAVTDKICSCIYNLQNR